MYGLELRRSQKFCRPLGLPVRQWVWIILIHYLYCQIWYILVPPGTPQFLEGLVQDHTLLDSSLSNDYYLCYGTIDVAGILGLF